MTKIWPKYVFLRHLEKVIFDHFGCFARPLEARYFQFKSKENAGDGNKMSDIVSKMKDMILSFYFQCFEDIFIDWNIVTGKR